MSLCPSTLSKCCSRAQIYVETLSGKCTKIRLNRCKDRENTPDICQIYTRMQSHNFYWIISLYPMSSSFRFAQDILPYMERDSDSIEVTTSLSLPCKPDFHPLKLYHVSIQNSSTNNKIHSSLPYHDRFASNTTKQLQE